MHLETFTTPRTARLALLGPQPRADLHATGVLLELWYVLHGYGELAVPFLENLPCTADGSRLIVAPEALSRHYAGRLEDRIGKEVPIGASWMTKEAREDEIRDYLSYLTGLHISITERLGGVAPPVTVLGFSQGGATSSRWVASGTTPIARHILWGCAVPPELEIANPHAPLRQADTLLVVGARDRFAPADVVARERERLDGSGFPYRAETFDGGHRLDDATLRRIVGQKLV